ncbi:MAG: hypothetical protein CL773_04995 [Chloroflexi bacterium]|nr:hypothetical protein [Chloroflexota bacterium]|tara:strand:+ start:8044 stop:8532 length:489 start_codon:yes stop_codon:yes gene_type:complete
MIRHFTSTVFVVIEDKIALHWHSKVKMWLPPGGHVDENEDPVQTALRECKEEMGIDINIISEHSYKFNDPKLSNIYPPEAILIESVEDQKIGPHQHIDFIYFAYPKNLNFNLSSEWILVSQKDLISETKFTNPNGEQISPPHDVLVIGIDAINKLKKPKKKS